MRLMKSGLGKSKESPDMRISAKLPTLCRIVCVLLVVRQGKTLRAVADRQATPVERITTLA
jgi:hypothetical protein